MTQTVISHYRVLHQLGEGGMGVVYRAEDLQLSREVAIKFLRREDGAHAPWLARFEREARLASALQHPNICTIHELGAQDGVPFIVMELLEGRTMRQRMEDGPLSAEQVVSFGAQIAMALDAAHTRGIVHRDIKPANLFVTHGEHLKVLDFGLAKLADHVPVNTVTRTQPSGHARTGIDVTVTGAAVGTAAYMSPEQATGARVDARTDLFSFGSVLYEMATGRRAFPGENTATVIQRLLRGEFIPPRALKPALPERLETIILRAMEVDPNRRYQSAAAMLEDLRSLARGLLPDASATRGDSATGPHAAPLNESRRTWRWASAALIVVVALAGGAWRWMQAAGPASEPASRHSILVGDFANSTGDSEFDATLSMAIRAQLGQSPFLAIVPDDRIADELRRMRHPDGAELSQTQARALCERLGLKAMLDGTIAAVGTNYFVTVNASDCQTGEVFGRQQGEVARKEEVIAKLGAMASTLRTTLGESLPSIKQFDVPIQQATTPSLAALKAYALGVAERRRGSELESVAFFNRAIELDPEFAAAYTTLSTVYGSLGEWRRSEEYAQQAYDLQKRVSEVERLFITYQYHDRVTGNQDEAARTLELWKSAYPYDYRPANALALIANRFGQYDRAVAESSEALKRTPGSGFAMSNLATAYRGLGRFEESRKVADEAVKLDVATVPTRRLLYQLGMLAGDGSASTHVNWAKGKSREFDLVSAQAQVAAFAGQLDQASLLYAQAADMANARGLSGTASGFLAHLALTEAVYGDPHDASDRVRALVARTATAAESPGALPRFRAAVALGLAGHGSDAREIISSARKQYPESTVFKTVLVPTSEAAIALGRGAANDAVAALRAAAPSEFGTAAGLVPTFLRGEAFLALGDLASARREYQNVLAHRGADPFAPVVPLAHLGLARAWQRAGDLHNSRREYDELLTIWKDADPDLPVLQRARVERGQLDTAPAAASTAAR